MSEHAEVNGPIALSDTLSPLTDRDVTAPPVSGNPDTTTGRQKKMPRGKPFVSGDPRSNLAGRPRKGETLADKLARADARIARKAIAARDKRLTSETQVGNRAWENYLAYRVGLPKQAFVVEHTDALGIAWLQAVAGQTVDGSARVLDDNDTP